MKLICCLICLFLMFVSCDNSQAKFHEIQFYPVIKTEFDFVEESVFDNDPVALRLESRLMYENRAIEGVFEHINENELSIYSDRSIMYNNILLAPFSNLKNQPFIEVDLIEQERSGGSVPDCYIIWLDRNKEAAFSSNQGYFTLYIEGLTRKGYEFKDSTIFKIE